MAREEDEVGALPGWIEGDYFNPIHQERREAHAAANLLLSLTDGPGISGSRVCWVCGQQRPRDHFHWEVLDDHCSWQPLCTTACWRQLPAPDVRWNEDRYGGQSLGPCVLREQQELERVEHSYTGGGLTSRGAPG